MSTDTVYLLDFKQINELQRILNNFDVLKVGTTDKGKIIVEYADHFAKLQVKVINP